MMKLIMIAMLLLIGVEAKATQQIFTSHVLGIITESEGTSGYCQVITPWPNKTDCPQFANGRTYLSVDCGGQYGSVSGAREVFKQLQMAMLIDKQAQIWVDDAYKIDGWCVIHKAIVRSGR